MPIVLICANDKSEIKKKKKKKERKKEKEKERKGDKLWLTVSVFEKRIPKMYISLSSLQLKPKTACLLMGKNKGFFPPYSDTFSLHKLIYIFI